MFTNLHPQFYFFKQRLVVLFAGLSEDLGVSIIRSLVLKFFRHVPLGARLGIKILV